MGVKVSALFAIKKLTKVEKNLNLEIGAYFNRLFIDLKKNHYDSQNKGLKFPLARTLGLHVKAD